MILMGEEKFVPPLRFSGFDDEWETIKIGECLEVKYGKDYKHLNKGDFPVLGTGGVMEYVDDFLYSGESILIGRKGTIDKPRYINGSFWTVDTLFYTEIKKQFPKFLFYCLSNINWLKYNEASGVPSLSANNIKNVKINVPNINEQMKIANFLTSIDTEIELLKKKHESYIDFKKYLMQQIFSQKLRFDFDKEWKKVKLKDIVERVTRKNTNLETDLALTISAEYGLIDQEEFFNKIVASKSLKNYYLIKNGEFAYNKSYSNGYPYGAIKRLDDYPMGALSTLYICFKPTDISSDYLKEYFETTFWYKEIYSIAVEGARNHGLLNINVNDFFNTKHLIPPSTEEQEKIADLFKSINSKIDAVNNDLNLVKNFKKGLLQQMFI